MQLPPSTTFEARLIGIQYAARDVNLYEFARPDGARLMDVEPGAHIDVTLPNGITRQYSLIAPGPAPDRYIVAVKRDPNSRGGSRFMHDQLRVGQIVTITGPRNNFRLDEGAEQTVLIAGGIGITPIWCMVQRLRELPAERRTWTLHYSCRTRAEAAFLAGLEQSPEVRLNFDDESGRVLDIAAVVGERRLAHIFIVADQLRCLRRSRPRPQLGRRSASTSSISPPRTRQRSTAGSWSNCDAPARNS